MITIANLGTIQEAQNLKLVLGSAGIEAFIPDEISADLFPHFFNTRPGVRLQVTDKDEAEARQILEQGFDEIDFQSIEEDPAQGSGAAEDNTKRD